MAGWCQERPRLRVSTLFIGASLLPIGLRRIKVTSKMLRGGCQEDHECIAAYDRFKSFTLYPSTQALRTNALRDIARSDASTDRLLEIITGKDNFNGCIAEERLTDGRFLKTSR